MAVQAPPSSAPAEWEACLVVEHKALQSFIALLEEEQRTLLSGQPETLLELADHKTRHVETLTRLAQQRRQLQPVEPTAADARVCQLWMDIRQMAEQAEQLNRTNGELIQIKLRNNQQALTVLNQAANSASLYGPDGQQNLPAGGRNLGRV